MKWSNILHWIAAISGVLGLIFFLAGVFNIPFGISRSNLFNDAPILLLISIAFGIGTLTHLKLERK